MNNTTAIEWLLQQINSVKPHQFCSIETIKEWCEQAKEMEKQEIIQAAIWMPDNFGTIVRQILEHLGYKVEVEYLDDSE